MESILTKNQTKEYRAEYIDTDGEHVIIATVRYDDRCGNGHNTFSITGNVYGKHGSRRDVPTKTKNGKTVYLESCGCVHDKIAAHMPELAGLIKWHGCTSEGPLHYIENTLYLAGDHDCWGLKKGEFRQHTSRGKYQNNGIEGVPSWELEIPKEVNQEVYSTECPAPVVLHYKPHGRTGEGKEREIEKARVAAIWPEATEEQLSQEPEKLKADLLARLPSLMADFRKVVESLGFIY